jgi:hypothetical protein
MLGQIQLDSLYYFRYIKYMNKLMNLNIVFGMGLLLLVPVALFPAPTEESLIQAWENIQKKDPKTVVFEYLSPGNYHFKTERFPFDGELKVLNVTIDERMESYDYGYIMGVVEVELVDLPEDFLEKYSYSYSTWIQNNMLYYDEENEKWLSTKEYYGQIKEKIPSGYLMDVFNYAPSFIFFFLFLFLLIIVFVIQRKNRKYLDFAQDLNKRQMEIVEESHRLAKKNHKVLTEILKELRKKK